jgi:hypothetical protein
MPPAGGASAKASIPRKRMWWARAVGAVDHRMGFAGHSSCSPVATRRPTIGDDAALASIT